MLCKEGLFRSDIEYSPTKTFSLFALSVDLYMGILIFNFQLSTINFPALLLVGGVI